MNNPPAFPKPKLMQQAVSFDHEDGMTLRDYFAAKAMANAYTQHDGNPDMVAKWAYAVADAMLKAREA